MMRGTLFVFITFAVALCTATDVKNCRSDSGNAGNSVVSISNCNKPPCILKKNTIVKIEQKFVPQNDVSGLKTKVTALVAGIDLPFIGVDNTNACGNIYNLSGEKVSCPLKKNTEYIYRNEFRVMNYYPRINTKVHYALMDKNLQVTCFEVPVRIS